MLSAVTNNQAPARLGDLLIEAGLIHSADLVEALQVSKRLRTPLGRVLIAADCITQDVLDSGLQAQVLVRKGLNLRSAAKALSLAAAKRIPLRQARQEVEHRERLESPIKRLGEILLGAGIADRDQLDQAFMESTATERSFGDTLVNRGVLPPSLLALVLQEVEKVTEGTADLSQAIASSKAAHSLWSRAKASHKPTQQF